MMVTVRTMRSAAAMDVDISVWIYIKVCYCIRMHWSDFPHYTESFSDLVSLLCVCTTEKPGVCPRRFFGVGFCAELCAYDIECPNDEKCCRTICGRECTTPFKGIGSVYAF